MCIARDITLKEKARQQSHDLKEFMIREVLKPLLPIFTTDLQYSRSGSAVKAIILRVMRKLNNVKE